MYLISRVPSGWLQFLIGVMLQPLAILITEWLAVWRARQVRSTMVDKVLKGNSYTVLTLLVYSLMTRINLSMEALCQNIYETLVKENN